MKNFRVVFKRNITIIQRRLYDGKIIDIVVSPEKNNYDAQLIDKLFEERDGNEHHK